MEDEEDDAVAEYPDIDDIFQEMAVQEEEALASVANIHESIALPHTARALEHVPAVTTEPTDVPFGISITAEQLTHGDNQRVFVAMNSDKWENVDDSIVQTCLQDEGVRVLLASADAAMGIPWHERPEIPVINTMAKWNECGAYRVTLDTTSMAAPTGDEIFVVSVLVQRLTKVCLVAHVVFCIRAPVQGVAVEDAKVFKETEETLKTSARLRPNAPVTTTTRDAGALVKRPGTLVNFYLQTKPVAASVEVAAKVFG